MKKSMDAYLEKMITDLAKEEFRKQAKANVLKFNLANFELKDFISYYQKYLDHYSDISMERALTGGLAEAFLNDVLWPKKKEHYVDLVTKALYANSKDRLDTIKTQLKNIIDNDLEGSDR